MATRDYTKPDFQSMYDKINQAWNTAVTKADENRRRYITDLGYSSNDPSYTSQAARLAQGQRPMAASTGSYQWTKNPYSAVQNLMRSGGAEKANLRDNFLQRGISGGIANQAESQIDFATGGERLRFGQDMMDNLLGMDQGVLGAAQQYRDSTQEIKQGEADYKLEQDYLQNAEDEATKPKPTTPAPTTPPVNNRPDYATKFIKQLQTKKNPKKNLNALYAYMRVNKDKLSKQDILILQKMAKAYRTQIQGTTGTKSGTTHGGFTAEGRF